MGRDLSLDGLKILLAIFVVGIHSYFLHGPGNVTGYILSNGLFRIAVPVFFIINGYFLYSSIQRGNINIWLRKVLLIYGIWMAIYLPYYMVIPSDVISTLKLLKTAFVGYHHIWYVAGMIEAGVLIFLLRKSSTFKIAALAVITFITGVLLQYTRGYIKFDAEIVNSALSIEWISRNFLFLAFPFMAMGYMIKKHGLEQMNLQLIILLTGAGLILVAIESHWNFIHIVGAKPSFDCLFSIGLVCPTLFILARKFSLKTKSPILSDMASWLYFLHPIVISILVDWLLIRNNGWNITILTVILTLFLFPIYLIVTGRFSALFERHAVKTSN